MRKRGRPPFDDVLTPAEWKVVEAVRHGLSNRAIAGRQGVSVDAVKYHLGNALLKLQLRDRHELRRWNGVRRSSTLSAPGSTMQTETRLDAIGQVARGVSDIARATTFYGEVLGLRHLYSFGTLAFFDCGGLRLLLSQSDAPSGDSILYFRVPDIHGAAAGLAARGVEFINAPHMIHRHENGVEEWMAFFKDPDGRPLALMAQTTATPEGDA